MTEKRNVCIRAIACILVLAGLSLPAGGAITPVGEVLPVYDGVSDPWIITENFWVGVNADGGLTVSGGSAVSNPNAVLGFLDGITGSATITGPGSSWLTSGWLVVGYEGIGNLLIEAGGLVGSDIGILGEKATGEGNALVTGAGSAWTIDDYLLVGHEGQATLAIEDGGLVEAYDVYVGNLAGSDGTVYVTDPGSELSATETVFVGYGGQGEVQVTNGGRVSSFYGAIGYDLGSDGTVIVSDPGSVWDNEGSLGVGVFGDGTLTITNGGTVQSLESGVGVGPDSVATVEVSNGGTWTNTDAMAVGIMGEGTLTIASGGQVTNTDAYIGGMDPEAPHVDVSPFLGDDPLDGTGTVLVTGAGSRWDSSGDLYVGYSGTGELEVSDAGVVTSESGMLGFEAEGDGTATVTGSGSQWDATEVLSVGGAGEGTLTVSDRGLVTAEEIQVGGYVPEEGFETLADFLDPDAELPEGTGTIEVTGEGHLDSDGLSIGFWGDGTLDVNDGGQVTSGWAELGVGPNAVGTATVQNAMWTIDDELTVGLYGQGDLTIAGGGEVSAYDVFIGGAPYELVTEEGDPYDPDLLPNGTGSVTVTGAGSRMNVTAPTSLFVGYFGDGTLDVNDGGQVMSDTTIVGAGPDAVGTVTVEDPDSLLSTEELFVGFWGQGDVTVANGGQVMTREVIVGGGDMPDDLDPDMLADFGDPLGTGTVTVTGSDSLLNIYAGTGLYVGYRGDGTLDILDGGTVFSQTSYIGYEEGSTGAVTVSDPNSAWDVSNYLYVGYEGAGSLEVRDGAYLESDSAFIANGQESEGFVTVTGEDSLWYNPWELTLGYPGRAEMIVSDGGRVQSGDGYSPAYIGKAANSIGIATVTGAGSRWDSASNMYIGNYGQGSLTISAGGVVAGESAAVVGRYAGGRGEVLVTGDNSLWYLAHSLTIGFEGEGELIVSDGGQVLSGSGVPATGYIGRFAGSTGSVTVTGEGSQWIEESNLYIGQEGQGELTISDGGYVESNVGFIGFAEGSEGLVTVTGDDSLWRVFHSIYVGGSIMEAGGTGVLAVNDGGRAITDELTIWETGTLTGDGTVSAMVPATVHNYGTIAPGDDGIGTLTVQGSVVFEPNSVYEVEIGGTEADKLAVTGDVTIDPNSTVQVRSVGTVVGTQEYEIIEAASVTGEFDVLDTALLTLYFNEIELDYEPNSVWLYIDAMRFDDPMLLRTYNQHQVAGGLQRIADAGGNTITEDLQMVDTNEELRDHYDQLGGRSRPSLAPIAVTGTTRFLGTISSRLRNPSALVASGNWHGSPVSGSVGLDGALDGRMSYGVDMGGYNFAVGNGSPYLSESRWGFWAKGYGLFGERDHSIEAPGYDYRTYGVGVGLDYQFTETLLVGLTGGYADTYVNYKRSRDDSDLRAMHFGFYGSVDTGRTYLDSLLTYTDLDYETERRVDLTGERLEGDFGGYAASGYIETGFDWQRIEGWLVQPLASFQWSYLALESYRESGGDAALGFKRQSFESYIGSLGAKVSKDLLRKSPTKRLAVQFRARWLHEFGDTRADVNTYFASDPTVVFNIRNESIARDSAVLGVGLGAELNRNTRLYVDYDTRLNRDDTAHLISGGLQHRW